MLSKKIMQTSQNNIPKKELRCSLCSKVPSIQHIQSFHFTKCQKCNYIICENCMDKITYGGHHHVLCNYIIIIPKITDRFGLVEQVYQRLPIIKHKLVKQVFWKFKTYHEMYPNDDDDDDNNNNNNWEEDRNEERMLKIIKKCKNLKRPESSERYSSGTSSEYGRIDAVGNPYHDLKKIEMCKFCKIELYNNTSSMEDTLSKHLYDKHYALICLKCKKILKHRGEQFDHLLDSKDCLDDMLGNHHGILLAVLMKNMQIIRKDIRNINKNLHYKTNSIRNNSKKSHTRSKI